MRRHTWPLLVTALAAPIAVSQARAQTIVGTIDRVSSEQRTLSLAELSLTSALVVPGAAAGDRVFSVIALGGRGSPSGLLVAFVERKAGGVLFVDRNFDGRLTADEGRPYTPGSPFADGPWIALDLTVGRPGSLPLPFRCRVMSAGGRYAVDFTSEFRLEGHADIGGQRTLVSLPLNIVSGGSSVRLGWIGLDANGDGRIEQKGFSGLEVMWSGGKPSLFRIAGHVVSVESVDPAARTFILREHPLSAYKYVDLHVGDLMPAFSFTDFDGRSRQLADFRGKYVLLDFWGTWCGPCLAEFPTLRTARERFAERGFEILGIDYEKGGTLEQARAVVKERGVTWPNAAPDTVRELVEDVLRITAFPSKILVGPDGKVVAFISFEVTGGELLRRLDSLIR